MTHSAGTATVTVDAGDALTSMQIRVRVRGKRRALWRVKAAASLVAIAARVLGGQVDLEAELG